MFQPDPSKIEKTIGGYILGAPNSLSRPDLIAIADNYRRTISQKFLSRYEKEIKGIRGTNMVISVKVDGIYVVFFYKEGEYSFFTNSPTHRVFMGLPVHTELETILKAKGITEAIIPGELFGISNPATNGFNGRARVYDFTHLSQSPREPGELEQIGFRAFDLISLNGKDYLGEFYDKRLDALTKLLTTSDRAGMITHKIVNTPQEIQDFFTEYVTKQGHEGIVVRLGDTGYKIKPVHTMDVVIIGVAAGRYGTKIREDQVSTTLVALRYQDGTYQVLSSVGGG